ncbi:MAG: hypothetical protein HY905_03920 [Deltaproteobacteria bacterium]|nr:hypothetical protein [Deltaproteobacteria bacterium]
MAAANPNLDVGPCGQRWIRPGNWIRQAADQAVEWASKFLQLSADEPWPSDLEGVGANDLRLALAQLIVERVSGHDRGQRRMIAALAALAVSADGLLSRERLGDRPGRLAVQMAWHLAQAACV